MFKGSMPQLGKRIAPALCAVAILLWIPSVQAGFVQFNPTGTNATPIQTIAGIDLAPGNALAQSALPLTVGSTFQLYYQATVSGLINTNGLTIAPNGLMTSYQLTAVASFTEVVTSLNSTGTLATFSLAPTQASNSFFELYYNPTVVANNLAGTGLNTGTLVLSGSPSTLAPSVGIFSLATDSTGNPVVGALDQYITNHYPGVSTVIGSGSAMVSAHVNYYNPDFIKTPISEISFNSSLVTPFAQVSPSGLFTGAAGGGAPGITPNLGSINGVTGPDFQFQADANFSMTAAIPEPASFFMASLAFAGVSVAARFRRAR